jgi:hypothetical protein
MVQSEVSQSTKVASHCCPNCLTLQRHRIDNTNSIQLWTCNNCHFNWKEIWSSYSQSMWSSQYQHNNYQQLQQQQPETISEVFYMMVDGKYE